MTIFQEAKRQKAKLRLAIAGPAGAGKTHSALLIAGGIADKVFLIDTEHDSAALEVGKEGIPPFQHATLKPPYTPDRYLRLCQAAIEEGAEVVIIDCLTHAWSGPGGLLDQKDAVTRKDPRKDSWGAWRKITPIQTSFIETLLSLNAHVICTIRTKTAWEVVKDEQTGKMRPVKIGLKPDQRDDVDYAFTTVFDISVHGHIATSTKDRTGLFDGQEFQPTNETGAILKEWLSEGEELEAEREERSKAALKAMKGAATKAAQNIKALNDWWIGHSFEAEQRLTPENLQDLIGHCSTLKNGLNGQQPAA